MLAPKIYGIIGSPVTHSLSPSMQNAAFSALKIHALYKLLEVAPHQLSSGVQELITGGFSGVNVTAPFKEAIIPYLSTLSKIAQRVGAVNTLIVSLDGQLHGYNTDVYGFCHDLQSRKLAVKNMNVAVFGAGGAARAIIYALIKLGCKTIFLLGRSEKKTQTVIDHYKTIFPNSNLTLLRSRQCLNQLSIRLAVNCTGDSERCEELASWCRPHYVYDLCYGATDRETKNAPPSRYINGLGMLLHQGALSFSLWTGRDAPLNHMRMALGKRPILHS